MAHIPCTSQGCASNADFFGSAYIVLGKTSGFDAVLNLSSLDGSNGFRLDGKAGDKSGNSISNAGNINGDGFDDLIISAPEDDPNGASYVLFDRSDFNGENVIDVHDDAVLLVGQTMAAEVVYLEWVKD